MCEEAGLVPIFRNFADTEQCRLQVASIPNVIQNLHFILVFVLKTFRSCHGRNQIHDHKNAGLNRRDTQDLELVDHGLQPYVITLASE